MLGGNPVRHASRTADVVHPSFLPHGHIMDMADRALVQAPEHWCRPLG